MKIRNLKRIASILLLAVMLLTMLTGCGDPLPDSIDVPASVTSLKEKLDEKSTTSGATSANLYYDNTKSMYGYVYGGTDSMYAIACKDIMYILQRYDEYSISALEPDSNNALHWEKISNNTGIGEIVNQSFYTFNNEYFDNTLGHYGPLQTLFLDESSPVDFEQLNIFITDLAEQNLNSDDLAKAINNIVISKEDYSVALYCVISSFNGLAAIPDSGKSVNGTVQMRAQNYSGERPVYFIVVGPTLDVVSVCDDINESLNISGLVEGEDFHCARIISKRGLVYSPITNAEFALFNDLYVADEKDNDYQQYAAAINYDNSNLNYNTQIINYDEFFVEATEKTEGFYYQFDNSISSTDKSTLGKAVINFALPLSNLADGSVADSGEIEYTIPTDKDSFKVYGYSLNEYMVTDEYGEETPEKHWEWNEIPYNELFDSTEHYVDKIELHVLKNEDTISRVENYADNQALKDEEYPMENMTLYAVENASGALRVKLAFDNMDKLAEKYSAISVAFNINAARDLDENIPKWITEYTIRDVDTGNDDDFFGKTLGLYDFYAFLIGSQTSPTVRAEIEANMIKNISDVVVNIKLD